MWGSPEREMERLKELERLHLGVRKRHRQCDWSRPSLRRNREAGWVVVGVIYKGLVNEPSYKLRAMEGHQMI